MTNEEYIKQHPEQFKDDIDKWLFTEFLIIGGCCSAEKCHEYSVARMVAEKLTDAFIEKVENFLEMLGYGFTITDNITHKNYDKEQLIEDFRKYIEEE